MLHYTSLSYIAFVVKHLRFYQPHRYSVYFSTFLISNGILKCLFLFVILLRYVITVKDDLYFLIRGKLVVDLWSFLFFVLTLCTSWNHMIFRKNTLVKSILCHRAHLTGILICELMNNLMDNTNTCTSIKSGVSHNPFMLWHVLVFRSSLGSFTSNKHL